MSGLKMPSPHDQRHMGTSALAARIAEVTENRRLQLVRDENAREQRTRYCWDRGDYFNPGSRKLAMERYKLTEKHFGTGV